MFNKLYSFNDIFNKPFIIDEEEYCVKKIVIPMIQRDYAQGRNIPEIKIVRDRFLQSLFDAVSGKPIELDFVYGDINKTSGILTLLDGQQRLTTLFLLYWYAAKKEHISENEWSFLKNFSYETRYSAREFCNNLFDFEPQFSGLLSEEIEDQIWFPLDWKNDPTIASMLVMLDAIEDKFCDVNGLWKQLISKSISFYFLPISNMGLTDEIYIKMNSRGKPLTTFENIKAELEHNISKVNDELAKKIARKIDTSWTDLLWKYNNPESENISEHLVDDEFLNYFKFICDVICYKEGKSPLQRTYGYDEFELLNEYFSNKNDNFIEHINILENYFNCWEKVENKFLICNFLASFMSTQHEIGKIRIASKDKINIFEDCLHNYMNNVKKERSFSLNRFVLLYAIIVYLQNLDNVTEIDFKRRIRIVNNLIQNSQNELADRSDNSRLPTILKQVDKIIISGLSNDIEDNGFNKNQLDEEKDKISLLEKYPQFSENIFELEDHKFLTGQISILGVENLKRDINLGKKFISLFSCEPKKIDNALMSIGDYGQMEINGRRWQYGSMSEESWKQLFHKSSYQRFNETSKILINLLEKAESFSNDVLDATISSFLETCEINKSYPFAYYYIKYRKAENNWFGKIFFNEKTIKSNLYLRIMMTTKSKVSENSYSLYLKEAAKNHLCRDDYGSTLSFGDKKICCENNSYQIKAASSNEIVDEIKIVN